MADVRLLRKRIETVLTPTRLVKKLVVQLLDLLPRIRVPKAQVFLMDQYSKRDTSIRFGVYLRNLLWKFSTSFIFILITQVNTPTENTNTSSASGLVTMSHLRPITKRLSIDQPERHKRHHGVTLGVTLGGTARCDATRNRRTTSIAPVQ